MDVQGQCSGQIMVWIGNYGGRVLVPVLVVLMGAIAVRAATTLLVVAPQRAVNRSGSHNRSGLPPASAKP